MRPTWYPGLAGFHVWLRTGQYLCYCQPFTYTRDLLKLKTEGPQYPSYPSLNDNIKAEAESVVRRLRDHPSVVIFAGNNEDYTLAEGEGKMDYKDNSGDYMNGPFPAYVQGPRSYHLLHGYIPSYRGRQINPSPPLGPVTTPHPY